MPTTAANFVTSGVPTSLLATDCCGIRRRCKLGVKMRPTQLTLTHGHVWGAWKVRSFALFAALGKIPNANGIDRSFEGSSIGFKRCECASEQATDRHASVGPPGSSGSSHRRYTTGNQPPYLVISSIELCNSDRMTTLYSIPAEQPKLRSASHP